MIHSTPDRFSRGLCVVALSFATTASASEEPAGESCAACHGVIVDEYRATGMARSIEPLRHGELDGLERVKDHDTGLSYALGETPSGFQITERWGKGDARVSRALPLLYAIGAGRLDPA